MNTENQNVLNDDHPEQGSGEVILFKNKDVTDNSFENNDSDISIRLKKENGDFICDQKMNSEEPKTPLPSLINSQHASSTQRSIYNPCMADTHSRIFGNNENDDTPQPSPRRVSTVSFNGISTDAIPEQLEKAHFYGKKTDGNPLTGEGYDTDISHQRTRMPPGGPSTPFW